MLKVLLLLPLLIPGLAMPAPVCAAERQITVRGDHRFAPFEYLDETGTPRGFDIDILRATAEVMNLDVVVDLGLWEVARKELEQGRIDVLAGMRYSPERDLLVDFSNPYLINTSTIFVRRGTSIRTLEDLMGKTVLVQRGDIMEDFIQDLSLSANMIPVDDQAEALRRLAAGEHDAVLCTRLRGLFLIDRLGFDHIVPVGPELAAGPYGFAVREGDARLLAQLNEGLRILKATGRYDAIYERWFGLYDHQNFARELAGYARWVLPPLLLLLLAAALWFWSLRRQVRARTAELDREYANRREAEAHLESERRFRSLVEGSPVPIVLLDEDLDVLFVNQEFEDLFGHRLPDLEGNREWWPRVSTRWSSFRDFLEDPEVSDQAVISTEMQIACRDGEPRHLICQHTLLEQRHLLVFNDITERKQAEFALQARVRIETMISNISSRFINLPTEAVDGEIDWALQQVGEEIEFDRCYLFEFDPSGDTLSNTHEWCAPGISPQMDRLQNLPRQQFAWFLEELAANGLFYCPSVAELGPEAHSEKEEWEREGIRSLIIVPLQLKENLIGFIGLDAVRAERSFSEEILFLLKLVGEIFANALERSRTEQQLRSAHQRLQDIIDFLPDATFVVDPQGRVIAWNQAIEAMTGIAEEQILGQGDYAYALPLYGRRQPTLVDLILDPLAVDQDEFTAFEQEGAAYYAEHFLPAIYNGRGGHVWAKASPLYDRQGKLTGAIETIRDISARKSAQEQLEASNRELETFVYTVSHDLRSPLTPIIGYADHLLDAWEGRLDDQVLAGLHTIRSAGEYMSELIDDLLALARVGQLEPPDEPIDAGEVVAEILENLSAQIEAGNLAVEAGPLPKARVPRSLLYQVFSNLIGNAIRYAGKQGSPIEIGGACRTGRLTLFVRDHGPGVPAAERDKIFQAFYRGRTGETAAGTGVGLATVQKIALLYGGRAWVEETPGGGATFRVELQEDQICANPAMDSGKNSP